MKLSGDMTDEELKEMIAEANKKELEITNEYKISKAQKTLLFLLT